MNLLHIIPYYAPAWAYGGVVRATTDLDTRAGSGGPYRDRADHRHTQPVRAIRRA